MLTDTESASQAAFPRLEDREVAALERIATVQRYHDGEGVFRAGQAAVDLFVVKAGALDILSPADHGRVIASHGPGEFAGDIDLLTRRPVIVTAVARGEVELLRIGSQDIRRALNTIQSLGEKLITAFQLRREQLQAGGVLGMRVVGPKSCAETTVVREFLHKNFVPHTWFDSDEAPGREVWQELGAPARMPAIECADGRVLQNPRLLELAECAGIWPECPSDEVDLLVVGAGPAGIAAAVYAASEGLKVAVIDRLGPGGQVGGSSLIENFMGFPAGLSGTELATRGVIQMLKFGATMLAPVLVEQLEPLADGAGHSVRLNCGASVRAGVVFVATGVRWRRLEAPGAARFERAGVYYACTSVEGFLHKGQTVAVIGGGNSAGQAALFLAQRCACTVHHLIRGDSLERGMSEYLTARIEAQENIRVHTGVEVSAVHGDRQVEGLELRCAAGDTSNLEAQAVFVFIGSEPHTAWLPGSVARNQQGFLLTGTGAARSGRWPLTTREPVALETTLPRLLAGGDVRAGATRRVGFAVGDGSLAVTCAHAILAG